MNDSDNLPLRQALEWCDQRFLAAVPETEAFFRDVDIWQKGYISLGGTRGLRNGTADLFGGVESWKSTLLKKAWDGLLNDFRRRIQDCEIYLRGVQTTPDRQDFVSSIPSVWAQEFDFDLAKDTVIIARRFTFVAVKASRSPHTQPATDSCEPDRGAQEITPEMVGSLNNEVIVLLLEEHAKRVVENDGRLIAPGKISVMPIIRRKMEWRAQTGQLCGTLAAEAKYLAGWIAKKVPSHQVPTTAAIENALREVYRGLRAQSNGIMA